MKNFIIPAVMGSLVLGAVSCQKSFLDLKPLDRINETVYYTTPIQFKYATNDFYEKMISWEPINGSNIFDFMDFGSDIMAGTSVEYQVPYGRGAINVPLDDKYWNNAYSYIRSVNTVLQKADAYPGKKEEIKEYVAAAKFFRAWHYFFLLKRFGGVPIITSVADVNSEELMAPRNSRYEVVDQIVADLNDAIAGLPTEQAIPTVDKGHVSKWAAEAFKARVLLYEATWRKYTGTTTDFKGSAGPAANQVNEFLTEAARLAKSVMQNGGYKLWNQSSTSIGDRSSYYLFSIDGSGGNPASLDKTSNSEFILKGLYDVNLRPGGIKLTHTVQGFMAPSRKMMDMYLCEDGLPISKSLQFKGYRLVGDEYVKRDKRLYSYTLGTAGAPGTGSIVLDGKLGYSNAKWAAYRYPTYRAAERESQDYPHIRLAEVYLIYAEALFEKNGAISDADLNSSINLLRARAEVASLTNALVANNGLDMLEEIRRERTVELFGEGTRYDDLKRWGIAEYNLNQSICGMVVGGVGYPTEFKNNDGSNTNKYIPTNYVRGGVGETIVNTPAGDVAAILLDAAANRNFKRKHYLYPVPARQIQLNPNLIQNNEY